VDRFNKTIDKVLHRRYCREQCKTILIFWKIYTLKIFIYKKYR